MSTFLKHFHFFKSQIPKVDLPNKFTFPFYYEPHILSKIAATELQEYLTTQTDWQHNFGINNNPKQTAIGKMFGVLVVKNQEGQLGYLASFSGKLANANNHSFFVPPVFDMLEEQSFFVKKEILINSLNTQIHQLENTVEYLCAKADYKNIQEQAATDLQKQKTYLQEQKIIRDFKKIEAQKTLSPTNYALLQQTLATESQAHKIKLRNMQRYWQYKIDDTKAIVDSIETKIERLKEIRKQKSASLQQELFANYTFINGLGQNKSLSTIFDTATKNPPAGAGECAAPKLLQYAFTNNLKPVAMAEFWWGESPKSEIKKHQQFYPACTGKCMPILNHMLQGVVVEDNPFLVNMAEGKTIEIVYEDSFLAVVYKPNEFLSVPGKNVSDSVVQRLKKMYPNATGPLLVHRLDMSTSGLLLVAKTTSIYVQLQEQFIKRTIKKCYIALLQGVLPLDSGEINLPLRLDLQNRPLQIVCYKNGKNAKTRYRVIERTASTTKVYFYPITGRTHQLRVHAAHKEGLNAPIVGDDLYGTKANHLHLHAQSITFKHPITLQEVTVTKEANF